MQRSRFSSVTAGAVLVAALALAAPASVAAQGQQFNARLASFSEVPSISSTASGSFRSMLSDDGLSLAYTLKFTGLSAPVTQSHIHFGQIHTNGSIMVFLCQTAHYPGRQPGDRRRRVRRVRCGSTKRVRLRQRPHDGLRVRRDPGPGCHEVVRTAVRILAVSPLAAGIRFFSASGNRDAVARGLVGEVRG
jgi:hypothetical protein